MSRVFGGVRKRGSYKSYKSLNAHRAERKALLGLGGINTTPIREARTFDDYSHLKGWEPLPREGWLHPNRGVFRWLMVMCANWWIFTSYFADGAIGALGPELKKSLDINATKLGILFAMGYAPSIFFAILAGFIVDRFGVRLSTLLFSTAMLLGMTLFAAGPEYYSKLAGRFIFGLGLQPIDISLCVALVIWAREEGTGGPSLPLSYGINGSFAQAGDLVAQAAIPIMSTMGLLLPVWCVVGLLFTTWLTTVYYFVADRWADRIYEDEEEEEEGESIQLSAICHFPVRFWLMSLGGLCTTIIVYLFLVFSVDWLHFEYGYGTAVAGWMSAIVLGVAFVCSPIIGALLETNGFYSLTMFVGAVCGTMGLLVVGQTDWNPAIGLVFIGLSFTAVPGAMWPAFERILSDEETGTAFGIYCCANSTLLTLGPIAFGYAKDYFGGYKWPFTILAGVCAFGSCVLLLVLLLDYFCYHGGLWVAEDPEESESSSSSSSSSSESEDFVGPGPAQRVKRSYSM